MRKKWKNSLLVQLTVLCAVIMLLMSLAFGMTTMTYRHTLRENTLAANEKTLLQLNDKLTDFYDRMERVATAMVYTPTAYNYFKTDPTDRVLAAEELEAVFTNTTLMEEGIDGIYLYDAAMNRIGSVGNAQETELGSETLHSEMAFSDMFYTENGGVAHYAVYYPVYDLESAQYGTQIGMCVLFMKADEFTAMLDNTLATPGAQMVLIDGHSNVMAERGAPADLKFTDDMLESTDEYYVQHRAVKMAGWRLVSRIPQYDLNNLSDNADHFLLATYLMAFVMLALLVLFSYRRFVYPMRRMDAFIKRLLTEPDARLKAVRQDEIGHVVQNLDHLLDEQKRINGELQESREQVLKAELVKKQLQILAYRNQINPHFLYNTFDCIRGMALYHDEEDIAEITMALSHVFRFAIKGENIVTVAEEVSYIKEYATIIEYRFRGKIEIDIGMTEEVENKKMIKLMLQPLVENAVFHGLEQKQGGGDIEVRIAMAGEHRMRFVVADTGCGIPPDKLAAIRQSLNKPGGQNGIGMANIYQRLGLFYGDSATFAIESEQGRGTTITIEVPDDVKEEKASDV